MQQVATSRRWRSATTACSCASVNSSSKGWLSATRRASSAKSSPSTLQMSSTRESGRSPDRENMRLTLDHALDAGFGDRQTRRQRGVGDAGGLQFGLQGGNEVGAGTHAGLLCGMKWRQRNPPCDDVQQHLARYRNALPAV